MGGLRPTQSRYNADGLLIQSDTFPRGTSYLQIFRDGSLEYGDSYTLSRAGENWLPSADLESAIRTTFENALHLLSELETVEPVFSALTLIGMKGRQMALPRPGEWGFSSPPIDRDVILSPDLPLQNLEEGSPYPSTLLPLVNSAWQAAGLAATPYPHNWEL